jgi:hypothetical protein
MWASILRGGPKLALKSTLERPANLIREVLFFKQFASSPSTMFGLSSITPVTKFSGSRLYGFFCGTAHRMAYVLRLPSPAQAFGPALAPSSGSRRASASGRSS